MAAQKRMLNLSAISRRLDVPYMRLWNLVKAGKLAPDATAGATYLFREESVTRVQQVLARLFPERFPGRWPQVGISARHLAVRFHPLGLMKKDSR